MTDEIEIIEEETAESKNSFLAGVRRVLLAGVGAVTLAQEEVEAFVNKLVEKGEIADKDGRKLINEMLEKRQSRAQESKANLNKELDKRMEALLGKMNVPTKADIEALSQKVVALSQKVDELKKDSKK
ncbi:MAG: ATP synthase subunit B [Candidatus Promineifilaceae bacterium]